MGTNRKAKLYSVDKAGRVGPERVSRLWTGLMEKKWSANEGEDSGMEGGAYGMEGTNMS